MLRRGFGIAIGAALLAASGGCMVAADLLNPGFASLLGIATPTNNLGSIIIRFSNDTDEVA
ncbi:MAG: hypothetical protein D6744_02895, partial [Planctomycetota bacterium]